MRKAESWGCGPENSNPCAGIHRYRETRRERFLLPEEYRSLTAVLARLQSRHLLHAAPVKLLLLTGCRTSFQQLRCRLIRRVLLDQRFSHGDVEVEAAQEVDGIRRAGYRSQSESRRCPFMRCVRRPQLGKQCAYGPEEFRQIVVGVGPYALRDHPIIAVAQEVAEIHDSA